MKTIEQIAAELQGYDPQALSADDVNQFLSQLVEPVTAVRAASACSKRWAACWRPM